MASYCEPMDVDEVPMDSEDKENVFHPSWKSGRPSERGVEDLDMSEMNMRLRLSCTPLTSPTPKKRFTGSAKKLFPESGDNESINQTLKNDSADITMTELSMGDHNVNNSQPEDISENLTIKSLVEETNRTVTLKPNNVSSLSKDCIENNNAIVTHDATYICEETSNLITSPLTPTSTPIKDIPKPSTSPILRGLKSVLSMFRPSQSPICPSDVAQNYDENLLNGVSPAIGLVQHPQPETTQLLNRQLKASTPLRNEGDEIGKNLNILEHKSLNEKSPHRTDGVVFNEDLINDLQWNDDTTIIFNTSKLPDRKLSSPLYDPISCDSIPSTDFLAEESNRKEIIVQDIPKIVNTTSTVKYTDITMDNIKSSPVNITQSEMHIEVSNDDKSYSIKDTVENLLDSIIQKAEKVVNECPPAQTIQQEINAKPRDNIHCLPKNNGFEDHNNYDRGTFHTPPQNKKGLPSDASELVLYDSKNVESSQTILETDMKQKHNLHPPADTKSVIMNHNDKIKDENVLANLNDRNQELRHSLPPNSDGSIDDKHKENEHESQNIHENESVIDKHNKTFSNEKITDKNKSSSVDFDAIADPFITKSRLSTSPPKSICSNIIQRDLTSNPTVIMIPKTDKENQSDSRIYENSEFDGSTFVELKQNANTINCSKNANEIGYAREKKKDIYINEEFKYTIETGCIQEKNLTLVLDSNSNSTFNQHNLNIESQEQSDAYLSADSGRDSEQLLDCEIETNSNCYQNESLQKDTILSTNKITPNETVSDIEDFLVTKTNLATNPSPTVHHVPNIDSFISIEKNISNRRQGIASSNQHSTFNVQPEAENFLNSDPGFPEISETLLSQDELSVLNEPDSASNIDTIEEYIEYLAVQKTISGALKESIQDIPIPATIADNEKPVGITRKIREAAPFENGLENSNIVDEDPFTATNKLRMSPIPPSFDRKGLDSTITIENLANNTFVLDNNTTYNINTDDKPDPHKDKYCSSANSSSSSDNDTTIKEVKTEDEDTMEGPDCFDLEEITENPFETASKCDMKIQDVLFPEDNCNKEGQGPKVILCRDIESEKSRVDDLTSEEEFMECVDEEFKPGELFINADTFDFLMNQNAATAGIDSGKESLFLKFDPLCAQKRMSSSQFFSETVSDNKNTINSDATEIIPEESPSAGQNAVTPRKSDSVPAQIITNTPDSGNITEPHSSSVCNSTPPEKPMMVVMPAVNNEPSTTLRNSPYTPTRSDRRTMTFSSPAIAAIDRLISLSGNNSPVGHTYYVDNSDSTAETRESILQLQELLARKEQEVEQLKQESRDLQDRLTDLVMQMKSMEEDNEDRLKKINDLKSKLAHKAALNKNMAAVVEEYERTIAGMIADNEQEKQRHDRERADLVRERDEQIAHLSSMEVSFNDLHTKYERAKQLIITFRSNEEALRKTLEQYKESQEKLENNFETLKQQAMSKLNNANMEFDKMKRSHEAEVVKLTTQLKRKELHITSLEETVSQKNKENEDLTAICDELISKVS